MKVKKIAKMARIRPIEDSKSRKGIWVISKILDSTQNSSFEEPKLIVVQKVPEKNHKTQLSKVFKKQKNTAFSSSENSDESSEFMPERQQVRVSETKNISTSYGKMILRFMETKKQSLEPILAANDTTYVQFAKVNPFLVQTIEYFTRHMFSVSDLRKLWLDEHHKHAKIMRIFSMNFLRKHSYEYIFNSRIKMYDRNLKYRHKIIEGVQNPQGFNMLKDF